MALGMMVTGATPPGHGLCWITTSQPQPEDMTKPQDGQGSFSQMATVGVY